MALSPELAASLSRMRDWALEPQCLPFVVRWFGRPFEVSPEDVRACTTNEQRLQVILAKRPYA